MKPTPKGWPRLSQCIYYRDPGAAIDWLCRAFGFELRLKVEGEQGDIVHSEVTFGEGMIMVAGAGRTDHGKESWQLNQKSPAELHGANTQSVCVFVDDVDAHCVRAREAGAKVIREPSTQDYGDDYWSDRSYSCLDLDGHLWWFMQRVRSGRKG